MSSVCSQSYGIGSTDDLASMIHDLRYALRALRTRPTFTLVAVATLALGIGVTAAVFTLANGLMLRPLPGVTYQDRVAIVESGGPNAGASYPDLEDFRSRVSGFSGLAAVTGTIPLVLQVDAERPHLVSATLVSSGYFSVLGVRMARGRPFTAAEETAGPDALVVVNAGLMTALKVMLPAEALPMRRMLAVT